MKPCPIHRAILARWVGDHNGHPIGKSPCCFFLGRSSVRDLSLTKPCSSTPALIPSSPSAPCAQCLADNTFLQTQSSPLPRKRGPAPLQATRPARSRPARARRL